MAVTGTLEARKDLHAQGGAGGSGAVQYSLIDLVGETPAVAGITVAMPRVNEAILQGLADVLGRQARHGGHHVSREGPHTQRPCVLPAPPVILSPAQKRCHGKHQGLV